MGVEDAGGGAFATVPLDALAGRVTGFESLKVAVGNWPIERMRWSRIDLSLVSWLTSTLKDAAVTFTVLPDSVSAAAPVMADVRPTASLCAGRNASFSRTR